MPCSTRSYFVELHLFNTRLHHHDSALTVSLAIRDTQKLWFCKCLQNAGHVMEVEQQGTEVATDD